MEPEKSEKSKRGKLARASGMRFESKVRENLENMGWIVNKWVNTVDYEKNKVVPAKRKFNPFLKTLTIGTGFPDFVCFRKIENKLNSESKTASPEKIEEEFYEVYRTNKNSSDKNIPEKVENIYEVIGLEVKSNGYLDQIEKGMCFWLLENKIFSRILIAKKNKKGKNLEIEYVDFKEKYKEK